MRKGRRIRQNLKLSEETRCDEVRDCNGVGARVLEAQKVEVRLKWSKRS